MSKPLIDQMDNMKARHLFEGMYHKYQHDTIKLFNLDIETANFLQVLIALECLESANAQIGVQLHKSQAEKSNEIKLKPWKGKRIRNDKHAGGSNESGTTP